MFTIHAQDGPGRDRPEHVAISKESGACVSSADNGDVGTRANDEDTGESYIVIEVNGESFPSQIAVRVAKGQLRSADGCGGSGGPGAGCAPEGTAIVDRSRRRAEAGCGVVEVKVRRCPIAGTPRRREQQRNKCSRHGCVGTRPKVRKSDQYTRQVLKW